MPSRSSSSRMLAWVRSKYRAAPKASTVVASATVYHRVSRRRMVAISGLYDVAVASVGGVQLVGVAGVSLLPEAVDHQVGDVGGRMEVVLPGVFREQGAGHGSSWVAQEVLQHGVFFGSQLDRFSGRSDL